MKRRVISIALILLVAAVAWMLACPSTADLKTASPFTDFEKALGQNKPILLMFTSDG